MVTGLGISSPTTATAVNPRLSTQPQYDSKTASPSALLRSDRATFDTSSSASSSVPHNNTLARTSSVVDFDPEVFRDNLMRQITDKLETGLDRRFSQLASALPTPHSPIVSGQPSTGKTSSPSEAALFMMIPEEANVAQLRSLLRTANAELERLKDKNQELQENHRQLERQHLEATHQIARLQDLERAQSTVYSRTHGDASSTSLGSPSIDGRALDSVSLNGGFGQRIGGGGVQSSRGSLAESNQTIQRLMKEVAALTSERDVLKIRSWELEKKPYMQQPPFHDVRSTDFIDLENERNRLIEELGQKTVAMEDLWNKNEALMLRATEYEKRVWELESQVAALEADCALLPRIRLDLVEMEARAVAADALVVKLQAMEGQVELVKSLQDRIQELETTNAELDHSNWDLSEKLNIANNQHGLLTREFESFRSKDKDDRRLEFLTNRNRELEAQLSAEQNKAAPDYRDEYERVSSELEKIKIRMPQLEGQSKQVALLRSKTLQLEKQIKTMEQLEPRLEEMQQLHERNLFLEGELGELEQLRAREMELEHELEAAKARVVQLETHKTRMNSFSGLKQLQTRARSGSVAQPMAPFIPPALAQQQQQQQQQQAVQDETETEEEKCRGVTTVQEDLRIRTSHGLSHLSRSSQSFTTTIEPVLSPKREFPPTPTTASAWPSGRSSMSMSHASHRMSTSSNTSTVLSHTSNSPSLQWRTSQATYPSAPVSPSESLSPSILSLSSSSSSTLSDEESTPCTENNKALLVGEPESFLGHADDGDVAVVGLAPSPLLPSASLIQVDI